MAAPTPLDLDSIQALREMSNRFGAPDNARKRELLLAAAGRRIDAAAVVVAYHDLLLFLLAYPASIALRDLAWQELARVADAAHALVETGSRRSRRQLRGTGVAWSDITIAFGWGIARWLVERFPEYAELDSFADGTLPLADFLRHALPAAEAELAADDAGDLLAQASAGTPGSRLGWLVAHWERLPCDDALRETLFDALAAFIRIEPRDSRLSRTFARGIPGRTYCHDRLLRNVDAAAILATPLPPPVSLSREHREGLVDTARAVLAMLGRETDPITQADRLRTRCYRLGRGVTIALYSARPARRPAFDSHVGFMLFKNAVPIAYGGGWPFLATCRIGVNVLAPFRGGESAWLFCQVLRTYRALFGVGRFLVEPYQFGAGNREGLASGAFWFYWRLGFRPVEQGLRSLGEQEFARMKREAGYRTPIETLRRFTRSDLELPCGETKVEDADPADLAAAVTAWISRRFRADRRRAETFAVRHVARALGVRGIERWPPDERAAFVALAPLVGQLPGLARWPDRDRRRLVAWMRAKGGDEYRFFALLHRHARLRNALGALAANARAE